MSVQKAMKNLAAFIRMKFPIEVFFDWHIMTCTGRQPKIAEYIGLDGQPSYKVEHDTNTFAPGPKERAASMEAIMLRGWGQPAQMVQVEETLRTLASTTESALPAGALAPGVVAQLARMMRALPPAEPKEPAPPAAARCGDFSDEQVLPDSSEAPAPEDANRG